MGSDVRLMFAPRVTYASLLASSVVEAGWAVARRPLLIALVIGTSLAVAATRSVSIGVVVMTTLAWLVVPLLQVAAAALLVASVRARRVKLVRGVDLMLAGHAPWSLWLLGMSAGLALGARGRLFLLGGAVALLVVMLVRAVVLYHFCRVVLACGRTGSAARAFVHQMAMWSLLLWYIAWAIALEGRLT